MYEKRYTPTSNYSHGGKYNRGEYFRRGGEHNEGREKQEYVFGIRAIIEAIESGQSIDRIMIRKDLGGDLAKELHELVHRHDIPVQRVPIEKLNRITRKNHQGAIAAISPIRYQKLENIVPMLFDEGKVPVIILLDGLTDTRNFGAIGRTAECAGVDAIVIPDRGSVSASPEAIKTSAGAMYYIPVCREHSLREAVKYLKDCGYRVIGASEKGGKNYTEVDYTAPVAVVMGAEDVGISDEVLKECNELVAIPVLGSIGSLNVSVAAGVMLYEVVRQRMASGMALE